MTIKTDGLGMLLMFVPWLAGIVLAAGWWKALAVFFPPYAWYLVVELAMRSTGLAQ